MTPRSRPWDALVPRPSSSASSPTVPRDQGVFWLYEVADEGSLASQGTHFAFSVPARTTLHAVADSVRAEGSELTRGPGPHPDISPDYYGAVFLDPDGHKIELVVEYCRARIL